MQRTLRLPTCSLVLLLVLVLAGCSTTPIRYLSSEACLISQGTTKEDVLTYMGPPKFKKKTASSEIWTFVQEHKSALKKTPVLNLVFGTVSYDLVYITFSADMVTNCQYRAANEKEYEESVLSQEPSAE